MPSDVAVAGATRPATFDFDAVFRSEYARVARAIARVVRDPARAEDLAVDTFWKLFRTPGAQGENAGAWLSRSAVRVALDELRRRARRAKYEQIVAVLRRSPPTPDELFSAAEDQVAYGRSLRRSHREMPNCCCCVTRACRTTSWRRLSL